MFLFYGMRVMDLEISESFCDGYVVTRKLAYVSPRWCRLRLVFGYGFSRPSIFSDCFSAFCPPPLTVLRRTAPSRYYRPGELDYSPVHGIRYSVFREYGHKYLPELWT